MSGSGGDQLRADLLTSTWRTMLKLLEKDGTFWSWVSKQKLYRAVGQAYSSQRLFWIHLNILHREGNLPKFTSRNEKGVKTCLVNGKKPSTKWCVKCKKSKKSNCYSCVPAVRFVRPSNVFKKFHAPILCDFYKYTELANLIPDTPFVTREISLSPIDTLKLLQDRTLLKEAPVFVQRIILNDAFGLFDKILQLLDIIYGIEPLRRPSMWIFPIRNDLVKSNLMESQGVPDGQYDSWGFHVQESKKWHEMQVGDYVVFGNPEFEIMARVSRKFVWNGQHETWYFGFTLAVMEHQWRMSEKVSEVSAFRICGKDCKQWVKKLREMNLPIEVLHEET